MITAPLSLPHTKLAFTTAVTLFSSSLTNTCTFTQLFVHIKLFFFLFSSSSMLVGEFVCGYILLLTILENISHGSTLFFPERILQVVAWGRSRRGLWWTTSSSCQVCAARGVERWWSLWEIVCERWWACCQVPGRVCFIQIFFKCLGVNMLWWS